eukprot:TRINITY_DN51999_c0_g1_i1.p1 TRINITY_DN51999_c0_g1~~TRINITY_DN51999_c0_g1_i1.p1  ORF type:complete len:464 (-),score=71.06 TRINITY_DN51999_c0_g1_i1:235-1554(-)
MAAHTARHLLRAPRVTKVAAGAAVVAGSLWSVRRNDLHDAPPSVEERFRGGLPRAVRHPQTGRFMNPWLVDNCRDPCEKSVGDVFRMLVQSLFGVVPDAERVGDGAIGRDEGGSAPAACQENLVSEGVGMIETGVVSADIIDLCTEQTVDWTRVRAAVADPASPATAVWLGHASVLCVYAGRVVLFDPVFSQRCSPFSFIGPKRLTPCPVDAALRDWPEDLGPDVIAISHAHYDHLDEGTVVALRRRFPAARWAAPLGLGAWFRRRGVELDAELDWWQEAEGLIGGDVSLVCLPAQHWANRWPWDRNETLWCSYGVVDMRGSMTASGGSCRRMPFFFAGDTGYCPVFGQIGKMFDVGLALVPIGAYEPRWFMAPSHCDPADAVRVVDDLGADKAMAIHWGTYPLTMETSSQQLACLEAVRGGDGRLRAVRLGDAISATE